MLEIYGKFNHCKYDTDEGECDDNADGVCDDAGFLFLWNGRRCNRCEARLGLLHLHWCRSGFCFRCRLGGLLGSGGSGGSRCRFGCRCRYRRLGAGSAGAGAGAGSGAGAGAGSLFFREKVSPERFMPSVPSLACSAGAGAAGVGAAPGLESVSFRGAGCGAGAGAGVLPPHAVNMHATRISTSARINVFFIVKTSMLFLI